jgi:hypothetical protein
MQASAKVSLIHRSSVANLVECEDTRDSGQSPLFFASFRYANLNLRCIRNSGLESKLNLPFSLAQQEELIAICGEAHIQHNSGQSEHYSSPS